MQGQIGIHVNYNYFSSPEKLSSPGGDTHTHIHTHTHTHIFIFTLLCGVSKGFMKALHTFVKPFEAPQNL